MLRVSRQCVAPKTTIFLQVELLCTLREISCLTTLGDHVTVFDKLQQLSTIFNRSIALVLAGSAVTIEQN